MILPNGYELESTFWMDFSIADRFGENAIRDTYTRAFEEWKNDIKYVTELAIVLNWKMFEYYEKKDKLCELYRDLWEEIDNWIFENKSEEDIQYYLKITD